MSAHDGYESMLGALATEAQAAPGGRVVQRQDGTSAESPYQARDAGKVFADVDGLFGQSQAYVTYKKERPEHRLMLWHRLQGRSVKETALLTGYSPQSVSQVSKQPWFQDAFVRLSTELGKDSVHSYLAGEVLPAVQRTVELATNGESEAVRLAANKEILDRYLGKSTVKVEQKVSGQVDSVVYDGAKLMEESRRLQEQLRARGINGTN
jgi:ribosomal protein L27